MLRCGTPFIAAFMPLVPLASSGLRGVVQPDVAALDEEVGDVQVVVVEERDAAAEGRDRAPAGRRLELVLAHVVGRVRLAGEDDLHRASRR